jgi:hypothetical protein
MTFSHPRILAFTLFVVAAMWSPLLLAVEPVKWTLTLGDPLRESLGPSIERKGRMADIAKERLALRLVAAHVNDAVIKVLPSGDLAVEFRAKETLDWYRGLLLSPGNVEVRPVYTYGFNWMSLASDLPKSIEFRGENPQPDFIWSNDRSALEKTIARIKTPDFVFVVGPDSAGWRSYTLGQPIGGAVDFKKVRVRKSSGGMAYVTLSVATTMVDRLAASELSEVQDWAIVLDGEVVSVLSREDLVKGKLELTAPQRLTSREESATWARQVAGRLAAQMPVPIAVMQE